MKEIKLTQNKVALVDDRDYEWLNKIKWRAVKEGCTFYAVRTIKRANGRRSTIRMHRFILNAFKGIEVDHYNTNGLDNQRHNIRLCIRQQNCMNTNSHQNSSSRYKGVCWNKEKKKWHAQIGFNWKVKHLGYFTFEAEAARAYNKTATELFGKFARPNIIEELNE